MLAWILSLVLVYKQAETCLYIYIYLGKSIYIRAQLCLLAGIEQKSIPQQWHISVRGNAPVLLVTAAGEGHFVTDLRNIVTN